MVNRRTFRNFVNWWTSHLLQETGHDKNNVYHGNWKIILLDLFFIVLFCFPFAESQLWNTWQHPIIRNLPVVRCLHVFYHRDKKFKAACSCCTIVLSADKDHPVQHLTLFANFRMWDFRFLDFANFIGCNKCLPWELILHWVGVHRVHIFLWSWVKGKNQREECGGAVVCVSFQGTWFVFSCLFLFLFITLPFIFFGFLM